MTDRGPVAVENLAVGDRVRSARDGGSATIRWIGHRRVDCVVRIEFAGEPIALNDPRLHGGWHPSEQSAEGVAWRWTDGEAALSLAGEGILSVDVLMTEQYWLDEPAAVRVQSIA